MCLREGFTVNFCRSTFFLASIVFLALNLTSCSSDSGSLATAPGVVMTLGANAGDDQTVEPGTTVIVDGSRSYSASGPPSYWWTFSECATSPCPTLSTPREPFASFTPVDPGVYELMLTLRDGAFNITTDRVTITVTGEGPGQTAGTTSALPPFLQEWKYAVYGAGIGAKGLHVVDLDQDGTLEILAHGYFYEPFWYVIKSDSNEGFKQTWSSPLYPTNIIDIYPVDHDGDGTMEIFITLDDGTVEVYNGATLEKQSTFSLGPNIMAMAYADLAQDGSMNIITTDGTNIYIYSASTHAFLAEIPGYGGESLTVGNMDDDTALEIATTTYYGHTGYVLDGVTRALEWNYMETFGRYIEAADVDNDGRDELIGAVPWVSITKFNVESQSAGGQAPVSDLAAINLSDVDGDDIPEILSGDGQWGSIRCFDGVTMIEEWAIRNPYHGVTDIDSGDVDQDGLPEVIWGAGYSSTGEDHILVADIDSGLIAWQNVDLTGPLSSVDLGDVDHDWAIEIVMVSNESNSSYDDGVISIFDGTTHELEWQSIDLPNIDTWSGVASLKLANIDADAQAEIILAASNSYDGILQVYDGSNHTLENQSAEINSESLTDMEIADIDADGKLEIVVGTRSETTGASGVHILIYDAETLAIEWQSPLLGSTFNQIDDIELRDIDNDGSWEIFASVNQSELVVFDGKSHLQEATKSLNTVSLDTIDIDADGQIELITGLANGSVQQFDASTLAFEKLLVTNLLTPIDALRVSDVNQDGSLDLILSSEGVLYIYGSGNSLPLWQSDYLGRMLARYNHLPLQDIDGDGHLELFFGSSYGLFQINCRNDSMLP